MSLTKRVLVVSYYFAPQNTIGAIRPTKFAKYLQRMGYEVTVICGSGMDDREDPTLKKDLADLADVCIIQEWNPLKTLKRHKAGAAAEQAVPAKQPSGEPKPEKRSLKSRIANSIYLFLWVLADWSFERRGKKELKKLTGVYDAVFSSYSPMSSHEIASLAKKRGLAKRWVADFRDEMDVSFRWQEARKQALWRRLQAADELSAVSEGTLRAMGIESRAKVLCNGFDREDAPPAADAGADGFFRAVYCGQFHMGRKGVGDRDLTPIFAALAKLAAQGVVSKDRLKLCYAGSEGDTFMGYAQSSGLGECVELHGSVSREESLRLQRQADLLLMASWNLRAQTGILTGKVFEYLMMGRPIACYMSGDVPGSELKTLLEETGAGFCAEQAGGAQALAALEEYLHLLLTRWKQGEPLLPENCKAKADAYAYERLVADRLVALLGLSR